MLAWKHQSSNPLNCEGLQHPPCCRHCPRRLDHCRLLDSLKKKKKKHYHKCREANGRVPKVDCRGYGNYAQGNGGIAEAD